MESFFKNLKYQKGQAIVEYTLLLVVIVIIATGFMVQFSKPFQEWASAEVFKKYYACRFESAQVFDENFDSACTYPPFELKDYDWPNSAGGGGGGGYNPSPGSPPGGGGGSPPGGGGGNPPGGGNPYGPGLNPNHPNNPYSSQNPYTGYSSSNDPYWGKNTSQGKGGGSGSGDDTFLAGSSSKSSPRNTFAARSKNLDLLNQDKNKNSSLRKKRFKSKKKKKFSELTSAGEGSGGSSSGSRGIISVGKIDGDRESEEQARSAPIPAGVEKSARSIDSTEKSFIMEQKKKTAVQEEKAEPLRFGKFMRYFLIILLIAGILFFAVSQLMQINENLKTT